MWRKIAAGWTVASLVMLGVPMAALAGRHTAYKQSELKLEQSVTDGKPTVAEAMVQQVKWVLQAQEPAPVPPVAPPPAQQDVVQPELVDRKELADRFVLESLNAVGRQIVEVVKTLENLSALGDSRAWALFEENAGSTKELTVGRKVVGRISWVLTEIEEKQWGTFKVVKSITYKSVIKAPYKAGASESGNIKYRYDFKASRDRFGMLSIGMHRTVYGGGRLWLRKAVDGKVYYKRYSNYRPRHLASVR